MSKYRASPLASILGYQSHHCASGRIRRLNCNFVGEKSFIRLFRYRHYTGTINKELFIRSDKANEKHGNTLRQVRAFKSHAKTVTITWTFNSVYGHRLTKINNESHGGYLCLWGLCVAGITNVISLVCR